MSHICVWVFVLLILSAVVEQVFTRNSDDEKEQCPRVPVGIARIQLGAAEDVTNMVYQFGNNIKFSLCNPQHLIGILRCFVLHMCGRYWESRIKQMCWITIHDEEEKLQFDKFDSDWRLVIERGFGKGKLDWMTCELCGDKENLVPGILHTYLNIHCKCWDKCRLTKLDNCILLGQFLFQQLPIELDKDFADKDLLLSRQKELIIALMVQLFDMVTKNKYVNKRKNGSEFYLCRSLRGIKMSPHRPAEISAPDTSLCKKYTALVNEKGMCHPIMK